jgi:hypothetical protein
MLQVSGDRETSQERERERTPERESSGSSHGEVEMKEEMKDETTDDVDYLDTPMYAGSSPPRKAPIGSAPPVSLGRKESKWRRSVMGLSDVSCLRFRMCGVHGTSVVVGDCEVGQGIMTASLRARSARKRTKGQGTRDNRGHH